MNRNRTYRPSDNKVSPASIISSMIGVVGIVLYILLIQMSAKNQGNLPVGYGLIPWLIFVLAGVGTYLAYNSLKDTITIIRWKILGGATNILLVVFSLIVFFRGVI